MSETNPETGPKARIRIKLSAESSSDALSSVGQGRAASMQSAAPEEQKAFAGETYCQNHPHSLAHYYCPKCRKYFCDLCVATRPVEGKSAHCCRRCGQPCQPVTTAMAPTVHEPFGTLAARAFRYPFEGGGAFFVVTGTLFILLLDVVSWVVSFAWIMGLAAMIILSIMGGGYLFAFVKSVVLTSAQGSDTLPDWPDISDVSGEVVLPFFQNLAMLGFCFGPGLVLMGYGSVNENPSIVVGGGILLFLGLCYLPMALLGISMFDSVAGLSPMLGIPSIARTLGHYFVTLIVFFVILGAGAGLDILFTSIIAVPILPSILSAFLSFYSMMVLARTLGLLYRANQDSLGWFKPRSR